MSSGLIERLARVASQTRVPLNGSVELTWRCNLACVHCYQEGLRDRFVELPTAEWTRLFDEMAEAGCINLTLTGGEPLLRKDFCELYTHAHRRGFFITVFTNGALIRDEHLELWRHRPPRSIEVTLYGTSAAQYGEVAKRPLAHAQTLEALERLAALKLPVMLKTVAMRPLKDELPAMRALAKRLGFKFRWDSQLVPRLDGDKAPLAYRLTPDEMVELDRADERHVDAVCTGSSPSDGKLLKCGALSTAFNLDPAGNLTGCVILRSVGAPAAPSFKQAWASVGALTARKRSTEPGGCGTCALQSVCASCPAVAELERGTLDAPVQHHCELAQKRLITLKVPA